MKFKPVIPCKRFSTGANNFDSGDGLIEALVVKGDEQVPGAFIALRIECDVHAPR